MPTDHDLLHSRHHTVASNVSDGAATTHQGSASGSVLAAESRSLGEKGRKKERMNGAIVQSFEPRAGRVSHVFASPRSLSSSFFMAGFELSGGLEERIARDGREMGLGLLFINRHKSGD